MFVRRVLKDDASLASQDWSKIIETQYKKSWSLPVLNWCLEVSYWENRIINYKLTETQTFKAHNQQSEVEGNMTTKYLHNRDTNGAITLL